MAGNFTLPTVLANLTAGNQPLSLIDGDFNAVANPLLSLNTFSNYYTDTGAANAYAVTVSSPQTVSQAAGLAIIFTPTNTNTTASTLQINALAVKNIFLNGAALTGGEIRANVPVMVVYDGTQYNVIGYAGARGTFTITLTGFTASVTGTAVYSITNNVVTLFIPTLSGTSNATTMTGTGLPAAIQPATPHFGMMYGGAEDNSGFGLQPGRADISGGTITFYVNNAAGGWTNSGTKGFAGGITLTYGLN